LLRVSNLTKVYGKLIAVNNVSFEVRKGMTVLMLGPNGAGKTTVMKCILGVVHFRGSVQVNGVDGSDGKNLRRKIGHIPQVPIFYDNLTVKKEAEFVASIRGSSIGEVSEKLKLVGLFELRNRQVRTLSHGMKQKLSLALSLLDDPPLLLFDEPITNIDVRGRLEFQSVIKELAAQGKTILISTHLSEMSEFADSSIVLDKGSLVAEGSPKALLAQIDAKDSLFVKLPRGQLEEGLRIVLGTGVANDATIRGEWVVATMVAGAKSGVIAALVNAGYNPDDIIIEHASIESKYLGLLKRSETIEAHPSAL
jgi:ABC-type multidrug transport system ATPase subunit